MLRGCMRVCVWSLSLSLSLSLSHSLTFSTLSLSNAYIYIFTCELIHFTIQCMWNGWLHSPHTIGQSSPGILQSGQHPSNASLFRVSMLGLSIFANLGFAV